MSKTILETTIMISQIYEKYICYLNTNHKCQAFRNYYDLRERIVSGWIHENTDKFAEMWETVKYDEVQEFSSSIYMRHPNCDNPDLVGPYEIPNYVGCVLPSTELNYEDLEYFKPSRSSAQTYRDYVPSRSSAQWDYDDLEYFKPSRSSAQPYRAFELRRSSAELDYEDIKPSRSSAQPHHDSDDFKVTRSTAEPYNGTTKFYFDYDILQGGDNSYGCSYNSYGGSSVRETNQTNMTLSELDFKEEEEEEDDEMPELMEM